MTVVDTVKVIFNIMLLPAIVPDKSHFLGMKGGLFR